ncbi:MAG: hypothetical protein ACOYZ6_10125 [Chloroflexota bacterium]
MTNHLALEWTPIDVVGRTVKLDVFKHSLSATDGLPPYAQARVIDLICNQLKKTRSAPVLWVSVGAPGTWYVRELQRLVKHRIPIVILPVDQSPQDALDFKTYPGSHHVNVPDERWLALPFRVEDYGLKASALRILRILARLKTGHTREITSLAGFSETHVRYLLKDMRADNLIEWKQIGKYEGWQIRTRGLRLAHRSWNLPKGAHFTQYRREFRYAGERHRRVARLWRAWLEAAYPSAEIWESWTEVPLKKGIPDGLAWGKHRGRETIFWLEVDSGHSSKKIMERNYRGRIWNAYDHAKEWGIPIVFCVMGPPWVVEEFPFSISRVLPNLAMIGHDWREFGRLPDYEVGRWHEDLYQSQRRRQEIPSWELSFDPKQYPPKPKKRTPKQLKPKSTKSRFSKDSEDDYRSLGEFEREK